MTDDGVCRVAPDTPGLILRWCIFFKQTQHLEKNLYFNNDIENSKQGRLQPIAQNRPFWGLRSSPGRNAV